MKKEWVQMCYKALPTSADMTAQTVCFEQSTHLSGALAAGARPCRQLHTLSVPGHKSPAELLVSVVLLLGVGEGAAWRKFQEVWPSHVGSPKDPEMHLC